MLEVAVVGATGYTGIELIRLIHDHPELNLVSATSTKDVGRRLIDLYPALTGVCDITLSSFDVSRIANTAKLVFLAVPHKAALEVAPQLLEAGVTVVDLSADYRLDDASVYEEWYGVTHTSPHLLAEAVYGLPELNRDRIKDARLIACPGCYPTATTLALVPALEAGLLSGTTIAVSALSGVSGAGRNPSPRVHYCHANESVEAYGALSHRHTPEIEQVLSSIAGSPISVAFVPHLVPMSRGLLSTATFPLTPDTTLDDLFEAYHARYDAEGFVSVLPPSTFPSTAEVRGSNRVHIGLAVREETGTAVVSAAIDNLVKGASGQAIQCANLLGGFDETNGLSSIGPVV